MGKCNKTHGMGKVWKITHTFPIVWVFFPIRFPSYGILHHMRNAWGSPSISHSTGKCNKTHGMGWTWEIGTHTFPIVWVIFPIRFPSYGMLHHVGNAWVSPSIFHSIGKCNKAHCMRRTWEISTHTCPIVWALFSIRFPFYGILHHMGNACGFSIISHNMGKDSQSHRMGKVWEIGSQKYPTKPIVLFNLKTHAIPRYRKLVSIDSQCMGIFFSQFMENTWRYPYLSHSWVSRDFSWV